MSEPNEPVEPFRTFETEEDFTSFLEHERMKAVQRAERTGRKKAEQLTAVEKAELDELRAEKEAEEERRLAEQQKWQELGAKRDEKHAKELDTVRGEVSRLRSALQHDRCHLELVRAATPLAYNPEQVARLLGHRLTLSEDGEAVVLDEKGEPLDNMTPAQLVEGFLKRDENSNLVKAAVQAGGSGARGSNGSVYATDEARLKKELEELTKEARESAHPDQYATRIMTMSRELAALRAES